MNIYALQTHNHGGGGGGDDDDNEDNDTQDESGSEPHSSEMSPGAHEQQEYKHDVDVYDPKMYHDLPVAPEVKDIFSCIEK